MKKLCFAVIVLTMQLHGQFIPRNYTFSKQEAVDLVNQLFKACNPDIPANAYMPTFLREKLRWVYVEKLAGRLNTEFVTDEKHELGAALMLGGYDDRGVPFIRIVADNLLLLIRVEYGVKTGFNQMQKNTFALALAHEAVHLEQPWSFFKYKKTHQKFVDEELRTHRKINRQVVTELLKKGELIDIEFMKIREVLSKCGNLVSCSAFTEFINRNSIGVATFPK